jgi:hypothetical protein
MKTVTMLDNFNYKGQTIEVMIYVYLYKSIEKGRKVVFDYKDIRVAKKYDDDTTSFIDVAKKECQIIDKSKG